MTASGRTSPRIVEDIIASQVCCPVPDRMSLNSSLPDHCAGMGSSESKQTRQSEKTSTFLQASVPESGNEPNNAAAPPPVAHFPPSPTSRHDCQGQFQITGKSRRNLSNLRRSLSGGSLALDGREGMLATAGIPELSDRLSESKAEWRDAPSKGKAQVRITGGPAAAGGAWVRDRPGSPNSVLLEALALESASTSFDSSEGDRSVVDLVPVTIMPASVDAAMPQLGKGSRSQRKGGHEGSKKESKPRHQSEPVAGLELLKLLQEYLEQNPDREDTEGVSSDACKPPALVDNGLQTSACRSNIVSGGTEMNVQEVYLIERVRSGGKGEGSSRTRADSAERRNVSADQRTEGRLRKSAIPKGGPLRERKEMTPNHLQQSGGERGENKKPIGGDGTPKGALVQAGAAALFACSSREHRLSRSSDIAVELESEAEMTSNGARSDGGLTRSLALSLGKGTKSPVIACSMPFRELQAATDNFASSNLLGNGGFGPVHKGLLGGFIPVGVKQLSHGSSQGDDEFRAEVEVLGRLRHKNVVPLVGYCVSEQKRLLVYEFAPHGCLHRNLHDPTQPTLDWRKRWRIATGVASGICYLHSGISFGKVVHLDIRSSNILLQQDYSPMVADFGLARFVTGQAADFVTHVKGTFGYIDPEYATTGCLTEKSDVYAYGVVLLELISGRKAIDTKYPLKEQCLVHWANKLLARRHSSKLADPRLGGRYNQVQFKRMLDVVWQCIQLKGADRPTMEQVLKFFECGQWEADASRRALPQPETGWLFRTSFRRSNSLA
eukprot:TRINITY_DN10058_c0_g1_i1.p1 TRINITY_DN10058_c0_g1~~TRINITY_DN10058_c0_g1_i1.p1  ORF type:complete len:780 (-),score=147.47 TRINITY_DN10058_c0_g1_i1:980-3319(-)